MLSGQPVLSPALIIVCVIMVITAGLIYWVTALGSPWTVPWAAIRAAVQLAAVAGVLAAALTRLCVHWRVSETNFTRVSSLGVKESNRQYLWIKIFYAASSVAVVSSGRSTSLPFSNIAPAHNPRRTGHARRRLAVHSSTAQSSS